MIKQLLYCLILLFGTYTTVSAQFSGFSHEIGIIAGPVAFQSDYGQRNNLATTAGNTGLGIGIIHYLNFSYTTDCNCYTNDTYFNDHFKVRSELSYNKTELRHFGKWVSGNKNSLTSQQLKAMRGSTALTNLGVQLEYFPLSIRDFSVSAGNIAPFIGFGTQFSFYTSKASSSLGPLGTKLTTIPKYLTPSDGRPFGFSTEGKNVWSLVSNVGIRYKLAPLSDLMIDLRFQYFFSNWVDGLNPNPELYPENKVNDWLVWFNLGYIYYL